MALAEAKLSMDKPIQLEYAKRATEHSAFGVASIFMAIIVHLFIAMAGFFEITPFMSEGNEKEIRVAILAATVGALLAVRALQGSRHRQILAIFGLVLNALAIPAALLFLPYV
jgi:hypothetical protein